LLYAPSIVEAEELRRRIAAYPRWNQQFEFEAGVTTPLNDGGLVNRQRERYAYFFERLLSLMGGTLRGHRVLDLGCNAGFWSLAAHDAGADFVLGVDANGEFIEQAELVFEAKGVAPESYRFQTADLFTCSLDRGFDIVLCLGIVDQVDRPAELFELMAASGAQVIVIDTNVSRSHLSLFEVTRLYNPRDGTGDGLVLLPSRQAVRDLAARHGFATVALARSTTDQAGMSDYRRERRCAFICARGLDLAALPAEQRPSVVPWWLRDPRALAGS
jgi:tRNA (mo5U34)-methyltransferase